MKLTERELEDMLIDYRDSIKHLDEGTIIQIISGIRKLLKANRVRLDYEHIYSFKQSNKKRRKNTPYSYKQIEKMLKYCNERMKVIILVFSSGGIRVGAFEYIQRKHLKKVVSNVIF